MTEMYEFEQIMEDLMSDGLAPLLLTNSWSFLLNIAAYVLTAIALYTLASRRGIKNAWLSWVPVINCWIIGSLSDQYRYVVKGEVKNKRKALIILNIINWILALAMIVISIVMVVTVANTAINAPMDMMADTMSGEMMSKIMGPVIAILGLCLPLMGISIALMVIRYMAMYDIYNSCSPQNSVVFLVLSILFSITEPFFLFFTRNKDDGMPPRKQEPVYETPRETWNQTEYL